MNIHELDSFKLSDAVKFHNRLNPKIWGKDEQLLPEVCEKLMAMAADFKEFLGISDLQVKDITVSGSNAAYSYTPHSDIDLHVVVEFPQNNEIYQELFNAKKFQYNDEHNLAISGIPVELYVQNAAEAPVSQGEYSVLNNEWIQVTRRKRAKIDDTCVRAKVEDLDARIHNAIKSGDADAMGKLWQKIRNMRQTGLDEHGEFGCENIAFKILRTNGCIQDLRDARTAAQDHEMSLREANKPKQRKIWGFSEGHQGSSYSSEDGVAPSTQMFLNEDDTKNMVQQFIQDTAQRLGIEKMPEIVLHDDDSWSEQNHSFGMYVPEEHVLHVNMQNRHIMDILRTTAHELAHCRQHEISALGPDDGDTGSPIENEAHAAAGIIMRDFADAHPELFAHEAIAEASGYIPTRAQANDSRFKMALTADIKPGQTGREANKLGLQTDSQGKPALLMKTANTLAESLAAELSLFEEQDLMEIKMTGKNLSQLAGNIEGVMVGLEFEMIVPNADVDSDSNSDLEADYDQDERVRDIDDCVNFFDDGGYNDRRTLRDLRDAMESDFFDWQQEQIDQAWDRDGFEFFQEWLDREEPFDPEDYQERAEDEIHTEFPDLDPDSEDFGELVAEKLREISGDYYTETWQAQGRAYDRAREEFEEEQRDSIGESDWLSDAGIRYASDVENSYSNTGITWPYYTSSSGDEADVKRIALEFMRDSGLPYKSVAVSSRYHGSYEKWNGSEWVSIGSNKPDDCFTIEPDGSLSGNDSDDAGLEFVSPPIPLEQVGDVMAKVQQWAGENGVYTGKSNGTSMHTNISIPGYSIDKLDYLKAALLLGDEHILRQFDRIGNSYAKPAIEKVKQLTRDKPEKAKELLDKMKSQLDAAASKIIHSGITDKFTSINTKDNRIEFRSPGGDYLSTIGEDPKKMQDTINRMVVAMDAAMDPEKYKEEYQKKLYKVLTGDIGSRKGETGELEWNVKSKAMIWDKDTRRQRPAFSLKVEAKTAKDAWKALKSMLPPGAIESEYTITPNKIPTPGDKDLLNIFSRYAAGEMPRAALKSFIKQAQLQRKLTKGEQQGKMWWNVKYNGQRMEVVANNPTEAKSTAAKEWGIFLSPNVNNQMEVEALRPYEEEQAPQAIDTTAAFGATPIPGSTLDLQRQRAEPQQSAVNTLQTGNWGIWIDASQRFAREPGEYPAGQEVPLRRFPTQQAAEQFLAHTRENNPNMRLDIEVREIEQPAQRSSASPLMPTGPGPWEIYDREDGLLVRYLDSTNQQGAETEAMTALRLQGEDYAGYGVRTRQGASSTTDQQQGGVVDVANEPTTGSEVGQIYTPSGSSHFLGSWLILDPNNRVLYRFSGAGNNQSDANRIAMVWLQRNPGQMVDGVSVVPEMG